MKWGRRCRVACRCAGGMAKPQRHRVWQVERSLPQPVAVGFAGGAGIIYMSERVRAGVAETRRVLGAADAERIEDEQERTRHWISVASCCPAEGPDIGFAMNIGNSEEQGGRRIATLAQFAGGALVA